MTQHQHESKDTLQVEPLVDPVCGMTVSPSSEHCLKYEGREYRFCSGKCLTKFEESPNHYLNKREGPAEDATSGAIYTCPMHPEIRQEGPGSCPKCGMALEPVEFNEADDNPELRYMSRRFWFAVALTAPLVVISMGDLLPCGGTKNDHPSEEGACP